MPYYENVFLVRPDVSTQQVETLAQSFSELLAAKGGSVAKVEHWGLRNLTYRIKKNRKAHYVLFGIDSPPAAIREFERTLRMSEDVLRSLTVRVDNLEEGPSAVIRSKSRDDRPRRDRRGRGSDRDAKPPAAEATTGVTEETAEGKAVAVAPAKEPTQDPPAADAAEAAATSGVGPTAEGNEEAE